MDKWSVLDLCLCLIEHFTIYIFFDKLFTKKYSNKFIFFILLTANSLVVYFIASFSIIKTMFCVITVFIGSSILYEEKVYIKSMFSITLIYIFHIVDIVTGSIMSIAMNKEIMNVFYSNFSCRLIVCLIIKLINIIAVMFLYKAFKKSGLNLDKHIWFMFNVVMLVFLLITTTFMLVYPNQNTNREFEIMCMIISFSFLSMSIIVIYFFTYICSSFQQSKNLYLLQTSYKNIEERLSVQEQNAQKLQKVRHDIKNHLSNVKNLIDKNDVDNAQQLLNEIIGQVENISIGISQTSGNSIIDAIVAYKATICYNKEIHIEYFLEELPELYIDLIDISSVISNLLDNAVEAAEKSENPHIIIKILMCRKYLTIFVKNSYCEIYKPSADNGNLITTKSNKSLHGYGIQIVNEIALKYDGNCQMQLDGSYFITNVLLKNSKK